MEDRRWKGTSCLSILYRQSSTFAFFNFPSFFRLGHAFGHPIDGQLLKVRTPQFPVIGEQEMVSNSRTEALSKVILQILCALGIIPACKSRGALLPNDRILQLVKVFLKRIRNH